MNTEVYIKVLKSAFKMKVYEGDAFIQSFPVGIGENPGDKECVGDKRTPEGTFYIVSIEDSSTWEHDFLDGKGSISKAYGTWFIRLSTTSKETISGKAWTGIGIHGTHAPSSIGTRCTEGCIRMKNEDLITLLKMIKVGTKVEITA
jgi:lipoprotein-anchoring transpeptidase ErfK/SrfK